MTQHSYKNRKASSWHWGEVLLQLACSILPCFAPPALLHSGLVRCLRSFTSSLFILQCFFLQCFTSSWRNTNFSLSWNGKMSSLTPMRTDLYRQKSRPLVPDWSIVMKMRTPNPYSLIDPKGTVPIGQNRAILIGQ